MELSNFLKNYKYNTIDKSIYNMYENFNYENFEVFKIHLDFLLIHIYNIQVSNEQQIRMGQEEFRSKLLEKFNYKCCISDNNCKKEIQACHIIPVKFNDGYSINNCLILSSNLHVTFDKYYWSINPNTLQIKINNNIENLRSIKKYIGNKIDLEMNNELYYNLSNHYYTFVNY